MTVWFTSDPHWGHEFVAKLRGFPSAQEHDRVLLANYLSRIRPGDQTWWLGDLAINNPAYALATIAQIPGIHHLVGGNHDRVFSMRRDAHKHQRQYMQVFDSVQAYARRRINNQEVLLSHFPYAGTTGDDHTDEPRYTQYRLPDQGAWLLHGHTHNSHQRLHDRQIHVGVDAWGMHPVSLDTIQTMIPAKEPA